MIGVPDFLQPDVGDDFYLSSVFEIENVMLTIQDFSKKIDHLKGLKKHRVRSIDEEISSFEDTVARLRQIILRTMKKVEPNQKTLQFPDIGKVSRRSVKGGWEIENAENVIEFFEKEGKEEEAIKTKKTLDSKAAKKLIDFYAEAGVSIPGTKQTPSSESLSISFEDKPKKAAEVLPPIEHTSPKVKESEETQFDTLEL